MKLNEPTASGALRRLAEERLKNQLPMENIRQSEIEIQRLLHELQVHQIELEMQNKELRQSRINMETQLERYTSLYDFAPVSYFSLARDGLISNVNLSGAELLGCEPGMIIGRRFADFVPLQDRVMFTDFIGQSFATESRQTCEISLQKVDHTVLFARVEAVVSESGQDCLFGIIDITAARNAENLNAKTAAILQMIATDQPAEDIYKNIALLYEQRQPGQPNATPLTDLQAAERLTGIVREKEQREATLIKLSDSLNQSGEAVFITDTHGSIEYANPAFCKITGYPEAEAIGNIPSLLSSGEQNCEFYAMLWKTVTSGQIWAGEIINQRKDGNCYPAHLTVSPVKNRQGKIINFICIQSDLTERHRLEEQLRQAQKMEAIGTLVGGIAHDFNNTLAGITGNLFLAKREAAALPRVVEKLTQVETLSYRAAGTIKQLLSYTRKGILQKHPLQIATFLQEAFKLQRITIPESISVKLEVGESSMLVDGDVNQLQQVLMNLLHNACDAVEGVEHPAITIELTKFLATGAYLTTHPYVKSGAFACISISDNGCGIEEQNLPHIYEPFFTTKAIGRGTGLGLSMAYGAIKSHGGHIEVSAAESGQGTIFSVYLPLLAEIEAPAPAEPGAEIISGHGETILLVDDNEFVLEIGKALLEELNYKVMTATNGRQALEIYRKFKEEIDLLVLDVVMPVMGGVEALRLIRLENPQVKAIFCTGYDKMNVGFGAQGVNRETVLAKPFGISELSQIVKNTLG